MSTAVNLNGSVWWSRIRFLLWFTLLQGGIQGVGLLAALMVVHIMPRQDYALFTIALSMQTAMHGLCDMGVSVAVTAIGGRVYQDRARFGALIASAMKMRWRLTVFIVPVLLPVMIVLMRREGADWYQIGGACAIVLIGLILDLANAVLYQVLLLRAQVREAQMIDLIATASRALTVSASVLLNALTMITGLVAESIALLTRNRLLYRKAQPQIDLSQPQNDLDRVEMLRLMKLQAPNGIFYCINSPLALWLLGFFGSVGAVADFGALGRFSFLTAFLNAVLVTVLVPGFARLQVFVDLRKQFFTIMSGMLAVSVALTGLVWLFPVPALWVLGKQYSHLSAELPLMVSTLMIGFMISVIWSLNASKTWIVMASKYNIPGTIITEIVLVLTMDLSTVRGALLFTLASKLPLAVLCIIDSWRGFSGSTATPGADEPHETEAPPSAITPSP